MYGIVAVELRREEDAAITFLADYRYFDEIADSQRYARIFPSFHNQALCRVD